MVYVCRKFENYYLGHFVKGARDLIRVDWHRAITLGEVLFYTFIYTFLGLFLGLALNKLFPRLVLTKTRVQLAIEIFAQLLALSILVYYIFKIGSMIPFPIGYDGGYCPNDPSLITIVSSVVGIVLVATQVRMFDKIQFISRRF